MKKGLILSVYVDVTSNWLERNKTLIRCGKYSIKKLILEGSTQGLCEISKDIVDNYRAMFESRISAGGTEKTTILGKYSYFFVVLRKVIPRNVLNDIVSWPTRRLDNSTKYLLHASMTIISKKKN